MASCLLLQTGLCAHVTMWALLGRKPGGVILMTALVATSVALVGIRRAALALLPRRLSRVRSAWTWEGWGVELLEAVLAAPLHLVWMAVAVPLSVRDLIRDVRDPELTHHD